MLITNGEASNEVHLFNLIYIDQYVVLGLSVLAICAVAIYYFTVTKKLDEN